MKQGFFFLLCHQTNRAASFLSPRDSSIHLQRQEFKLNDLFDLNKSESDPVTGIKNNCNNYTEIANLLADDLFIYVGHKEASVSNHTQLKVPCSIFKDLESLQKYTIKSLNPATLPELPLHYLSFL